MSQLVAKNHIVTLDYHVTDPDGEVVDEGREALVYLHGGYDDIFPKIEEALHGKSIGESVQVKLQPDEAFGEYDAEMVQIEPRADFPKELQVGMQFEGGRKRAMTTISSSTESPTSPTTRWCSTVTIPWPAWRWCSVPSRPFVRPAPKKSSKATPRAKRTTRTERPACKLARLGRRQLVFQGIQRFQRRARGQRVRVEGGELFQNRVGRELFRCAVDGTERRRKKIRLVWVEHGPLLEFPQLFAGSAHHAGRNAGQCGNLDAVALVGRTFFHCVHEDDTVVVFDSP